MTELIRRLDRARFLVHVACFRREGAWLPRVIERAASVVEFPIRGFSRPASVRQLSRFAAWCRRERIAILQTCDLYANVFGLLGGALAGVPLRIASRRELNPDKTAGQLRLQRLAYRFADRVVANSPAAAAFLADEGVPRSMIAIVANGLDADAFVQRPPREQVRRVITVANLRTEKSHETLIAAAALLSRSCPELRYVIVGDGPRRAELEAFARQEGVDRIIEFTGHREDVTSLLADADVFVLPSRSEAFPNAAIEAMAAGLPVIASAVGGLLDLFRAPGTGVLVPPCDPAALAFALQRLHANPGAAAAMGAAARHEVRSRYSFERMVSAFEDLYDQGLAARRVARPQTVQAGV